MNASFERSGPLAELFTHVIGFDDAPFGKAHRGDVLVVGTVYAGQALVGVISGKVREKKRGFNEAAAFSRG